MTFRNAAILFWLFACVFVAFGIVYAERRKLRTLARLGDPTDAKPLLREGSRSVLWTRHVLFVVGIALLVIGLAGPQYGSRTTVLAKRGIDIVIALDFSKSMLARDVRPSRIERAKAEILRFVSELDGDRVGVVAFAGETIEFPMTTDYSALGLFFRDMGPDDMPVGGTAIGRALESSGNMLERAGRAAAAAPANADGARAQRSQVVLLFTDGEDHEGDPLAAARALADKGIRVFSVGIGTRSGEPIPTYAADGTWTGYQRDEQGNVVTSALTESNERQLREIAQVSHGLYFSAGRGGVGVDAIRREIRQMHQDEHRTRRVTVQEDRYAFAIFPAFLCFILDALLPRLLREKKKTFNAAVSEKKGTSHA